MPPLPAAANVLRIAVNYGDEHAPMAAIFHVKTAGDPPSSAALATYLGVWNTTFLPALLDNRSTNLVVSEIKAECLTSSTSPVASITGTAHGTLAGTDLPASICGLIHWPIARRYRGGHPRTYLGGVVQAQVSDNQLLTGTAVTQFTADAVAFFNAVNGHTESWAATMALGALSYFTAGSLRVTPVFDTFQSPSVQERLCSQRRRLGKELL